MIRLDIHVELKKKTFVLVQIHLLDKPSKMFYNRSGVLSNLFHLESVHECHLSQLRSEKNKAKNRSL